MKDKIQGGFEKVIDTEAKTAFFKVVALLSLLILIWASLGTLSQKIRLERWMRSWLTEERVLVGYNYIMSLLDLFAALIVAIGLAYLAIYCYRKIYSESNPPKKVLRKNNSSEN
jgi:hypothetical protein